jgi:hypothetical protein
MHGECNICGKIGNWPVSPQAVFYPGEKAPRDEQELLCAACYEQLGAPFPDKLSALELRK